MCVKGLAGDGEVLPFVKILFFYPLLTEDNKTVVLGSC